MNVYPIDSTSVSAVATLMSSIKPDWWDYEGAFQQLQDVSLLARLTGWYLGEEGAPKGWILCGEFDGYSYLSIENLGYDEDGAFVMEHQVAPLLSKAEAYAREKGYRNLKYVIGSTGLSCHNRPLGDYGEELKGLKSNGRAHFDYLVEYGFAPTGFLPNCYGENYHGIIMIKSLL